MRRPPSAAKCYLARARGALAIRRQARPFVQQQVRNKNSVLRERRITLLAVNITFK